MEQLLATAAELQAMADLIGKYPAEAQLIIAALEDGLELGPMRVSGAMPATMTSTSRVITVSGCADAGEVCRLDDCVKPAVLVIAISDDPDDAPPRLWCLDHWAMLGALFTAAGGTSFDQRALELIGEARHVVGPR